MGVDLPADIRDIIYDFTHWEWSWGHAGQTTLDLIAFVPVIGTVKYADEAGTIIKHTDEVGDALKHSDEVVESIIRRGDGLNFGGITKKSTKLQNEMALRQWTESSVKDTVNVPFTTRVSVNKANGNPATVFYTKEGAYVVVDDVTNEVIQVSDRINPAEWIPDDHIVNPYKPWEK